MQLYTVTRVLLSDDGTVDDFSTDICLNEADARRLCSEDFKIKEDQLIIGETMYRVDDCWYDDWGLAADSGDIDLHLRVDIHMRKDWIR